MLRSLGELRGYNVKTQDGQTGKVHDFLFDDDTWIVRYLVVNTGAWLKNRLVLVPPHKIRDADWESQLLTVGLTDREIESSPPIDLDEPVSRQHETALYAHYGWQPYWPGTAAVAGFTEGAVGANMAVSAQAQTASDAQTVTKQRDPKLRSVKEVSGYRVNAADGEIGHVDDFIVDDKQWMIRYAVVDTRNWLPGRKVIVAVPWFHDVAWERHTISTELPKAGIEKSPEYKPHEPINRQYEEVLYDFYGRRSYWG